MPSGLLVILDALQRCVDPRKQIIPSSVDANQAERGSIGFLPSRRRSFHGDGVHTLFLEEAPTTTKEQHLEKLSLRRPSRHEFQTNECKGSNESSCASLAYTRTRSNPAHRLKAREDVQENQSSFALSKPLRGDGTACKHAIQVHRIQSCFAYSRFG